MNIFPLVGDDTVNTSIPTQFIRTAKRYAAKSYKHYKIPRVCHQTFSTKQLPDRVQQLVTLNRSRNPNIKFKLYDDADIDLYIRSHFSPRVHRCYKIINKNYGASRADFFRYCVLYREGGVYLDIKSEITKNLFEDVVQPSDTAVLDIPRALEDFRSMHKNWVWEQWLLIFAPKHDYLRRAIERICNEIEHHCSTINDTAFQTSVFESKSRHQNTTDSKEIVMRLTGPDGLANSINSSILANGVAHRCVNYKTFAKLLAIDRTEMYKPGEFEFHHYSKQTSPLLMCHATPLLSYDSLLVA